MRSSAALAAATSLLVPASQQHQEAVNEAELAQASGCAHSRALRAEYSGDAILICILLFMDCQHKGNSSQEYESKACTLDVLSSCTHMPATAVQLDPWGPTPLLFIPSLAPLSPCFLPLAPLPPAPLPLPPTNFPFPSIFLSHTSNATSGRKKKKKQFASCEITKVDTPSKVHSIWRKCRHTEADNAQYLAQMLLVSAGWSIAKYTAFW